MHNKSTMVSLAVVFGLAFAFVAQADEATTTRLTSRAIPERGLVNAVEFSLGKAKASLILPTGWRFGQNNEALTLQAADFSATLTLKLAKAVDASIETVKSQLASEVEEAVFGDHFEWSTGLGDATAFDGNLGNNGELQLQTRTYIIKLQEGTLVVTLTASPKTFEKSLGTLANVLSSLRME